MGTAINIILLILGTIIAFVAILNLQKGPSRSKAQTAVIIMGVFAFLWCFGYSFMGFSRSYQAAAVFRAIGLIGIIGYLLSEMVFAFEMSSLMKKNGRKFLYFFVIAGFVDLILFSSPQSVEFISYEGRTCFYGQSGFARAYHTILMGLIFLFLLYVGLWWLYKKGSLKRNRLIIGLIILSNLLIVIGAIFDTILPLFGFPSVPASCFGAFLAYMTVWYTSYILNAIAISKRNLQHYVYDTPAQFIFMFNADFKLVLANDYASEAFHIGRNSSKTLQELFEITDEEFKSITLQLSDSNILRNRKFHKKESSSTYRLDFTNIKDRFGDTYCFLCIAHDISGEAELINKLTELKKRNEQQLDETSRQLKNGTMNAFYTIAKMIDDRDEYMSGHSIRVSEYAVAIGRSLGLDEESLDSLRISALLHDIGRIAIPEPIINKISSLTDEEYEVVKTHAYIGYNLLKELPQMYDAEKSARYHHEHFDGRGYPEGLARDQIPFKVRIISAADAYDAMNSERRYRSRLSQAEIRQEFVNQRTHQFDPEISDIVIKFIDNNVLTEIERKHYSNIEKGATQYGNALLNKLLAELNQKSDNDENKYDSLSRLLTRSAGEQLIVSRMKKSCGYMAILDLDNLKETNDIYGHQAGDTAIELVGKTLNSISCESIAMRMGGDEFLLLLPESEYDNTRTCVESILLAFSEEAAQNQDLEFISLSIGICEYNSSMRYSTLLSNADKALYHIKHNGKNGYAFYDSGENRDNELNTVNLNKLIKNLKLHTDHSGSLSVESRQFPKVQELILRICQRNGVDAQLALLTLKADSNLPPDVIESAIETLQSTIHNALRSTDVSTRLSANQFLVIFPNATKVSVNIIFDRIEKEFNHLHAGRNISLSYDSISLKDA